MHLLVVQDENTDKPLPLILNQIFGSKQASKMSFVLRLSSLLCPEIFLKTNTG